MIPENIFKIINELGHYNLEVSGKYPNGSWLKWKKALSLTHLTSKEWKNYTERTIAPCEVVLDYDDFSCVKCGKETNTLKCSHCNFTHTKIKRKSMIRKKVKSKIKLLDEQNYKYKAYKTGGKGFHIHMIFPELLSLSDNQRKKLKIKIIKQFDGELIKASNHVMIMQEGSKHRKTGNKKVLIKEIKGKNFGLLEWNVVKKIKPLKRKLLFLSIIPS